MDEKPVIVIVGGTGFFGKHLVDFYKDSKQVIVLTRSHLVNENGVIYQYWDGKNLGDWVSYINGAEAVINLSGKSINCRFTATNKKKLLSSRIETTRTLTEAFEQVQYPPKIWINASAGAMYNIKKEPNNENETDFKNDFLAKMALEWENTFFEKETPNTRKVALRISLLLGNDGGVFPVLKKLTQLGLGGKIGHGQQKVSWMHIHDAVKAVDFILNQPSINGAVNLSTYNIVDNCLLMKRLRKTMGVPIGIPGPAILLKVMSFILSKEPSLLLDGVNFVPQKLKEEGFQFELNTIDEAFKDLCK